MRFGRFLALLSYAALTLATTQAHAQCAGFSDVAPGLFCNNVTWMKNRQVTVGCGNGTTYCPNEAVNRLQMALFMNRLGNTLTPVVTTYHAAGGSLDIASQWHLCQSGVLQAVPYTRTMIGQVTMTYAISAAQDVQVGIATSIDGAAYPFPPTTFSKTGPGQHQHHFVNRLYTMPANQTFQFAVFVTRVGSANVPLDRWQCSLQLHIVNASE